MCLKGLCYFTQTHDSNLLLCLEWEKRRPLSSQIKVGYGNQEAFSYLSDAWLCKKYCEENAFSLKRKKKSHQGRHKTTVENCCNLALLVSNYWERTWLAVHTGRSTHDYLEVWNNHEKIWTKITSTIISTYEINWNVPSKKFSIFEFICLFVLSFDLKRPHTKK